METESESGIGKHGLLHMLQVFVFSRGEFHIPFFFDFSKKTMGTPQDVRGSAI